MENIPCLINLYTSNNKNNFNFFNINGKTPLHLILDSYIDNKLDISSINFELFLNNTNINLKITMVIPFYFF